jgi:hypothetical protein
MYQNYEVLNYLIEQGADTSPLCQKITTIKDMVIEVVSTQLRKTGYIGFYIRSKEHEPNSSELLFKRLPAKITMLIESNGIFKELEFKAIITPEEEKYIVAPITKMSLDYDNSWGDGNYNIKMEISPSYIS